MKPVRNPWPLGITLAFVLFAGGTAALIVVACRNPSDLVSASYYEDELRFQTQLENVQRARLSSATVAYDASLERITVSLPHVLAHAHSNIIGTIRFVRPSSSGLDRTVKLAPDARGIQTLDVAKLEPGLWRVKVAWTADGADYLIDEKVIIQRGGT